MNTTTIPERTPAQRVALVGIVVFCAAPVAFGLSLGVASECVVFSRITPGHAKNTFA